MKLNPPRLRKLLGLPHGGRIDVSDAIARCKRLLVKAHRENNQELARELSQAKQILRKRKMMKCAWEGCDSAIRWMNVSGYCRMHSPRRLGIKLAKSIEDSMSIGMTRINAVHLAVRDLESALTE